MACASSISKTPPLKCSGNEHSIYARIISAVKEGRERIEFFRPAMSSKAHRNTYVLLNNLQSLGVNVEPMPCSNPMVNLFILSNFENWK